ncbi:DUF2798 domain-containing protein [Sedimentitalea sp. CY04]|uniref:DUF2798 domain-containing protein n=1 Tax=Parasedimentitalea denitrificans TaxID=2211118 RepID=A0ABX0W408_9RHOB|nr:DUF2798 domain-containing protein [Sedimentitalea sp. CY04]NIZ60347.1 DUF2798 domain-containing protein [Sedimentitalea sp. CY04]
MLPARFAPILFGLILSGIMSGIVTFVVAIKNFGFDAQTFDAWISSWSFSWPIAFAVVLVVAPLVRRLVAKLVRQPIEP